MKTEVLYAIKCIKSSKNNRIMNLRSFCAGREVIVQKGFSVHSLQDEWELLPDNYDLRSRWCEYIGCGHNVDDGPEVDILKALAHDQIKLDTAIDVLGGIKWDRNNTKEKNV